MYLPENQVLLHRITWYSTFNQCHQQINRKLIPEIIRGISYVGSINSSSMSDK